MTNYNKIYEYWLEHLPHEYKKEILTLDEAEIKERFGSSLSFGTAGLRGILGVGLNRMNLFTVNQATQGLANCLIKQRTANKGAVIAIDSRHMSSEFALSTALILASNGIKAYIFNNLRPTPELSFAVRYLKCAVGIVITASHNPAKYNGYKVYGSDGAQINADFADKILDEIKNIDIFNVSQRKNIEDAERDGSIEFIGEAVDTAYYARVIEQMLNPELVKKNGGNFKIVYTPLHGSGNVAVTTVLDIAGFKNVFVVEEQQLPNGDFPTVKAPNPELEECFEMALKLARVKQADLIVATDPDADRVGIMTKVNDNKYIRLTGNQIGALLTEYIASNTANTLNGVVVKTIVSTNMIKKICEEYGLELWEVLTGFKFIGEKIKECENTAKRYIFGFEESYGYLKGTYARDKDAVAASLLIAEMALYYRDRGFNLYEQMQHLYKKYGYFSEETISLNFEGIRGAEQINGIMSALRNNVPKTIAGMEVINFRDLKCKNSDLPPADVLQFKLSGDNSFIVRPSGTEPKIKFYLMFCGEDIVEVNEKLVLAKEFIQSVLLANRL